MSGCASVQELERFKAFVKTRPPFDVVVDGLNVANSSGERGAQSEMVRKHTMCSKQNVFKER